MLTIQSKWESYRRLVVPKDASPAQVTETMTAFYAGASATFALMTQISDREDEEAAVIDPGKGPGNLEITIPRLHWAIVGGESGPKARPTHPDWVRSIRDQSLAANVPFFFKQWGEWAPVDLNTSCGVTDWLIVDQDGGIDIPDHRTPLEDAGEVSMRQAGKKAAGRLLDGVTWDGMPE